MKLDEKLGLDSDSGGDRTDLQEVEAHGALMRRREGGVEGDDAVGEGEVRREVEVRRGFQLCVAYEF
ncbi:hypothetical protein GmHk_07G020594 [Glycine max]|uniref:Uncharacterized protein n=2 Tax=Glycine subgen. Soja TaxID=1462606 RepID=K7L3J4_SOYBN|nr:hypothetical protein JHK87_019561 [Glycine soja]KAH1088342.1 hypothetical protein GYH30_019405 [Glycine max]KAH1243537.1 hypothetical protein GmHk_07G020594 [Glycine max]KHN02888.1 hypothetical protein glysoja_009754 [Glycine soja]RZC04401.1 hypothetical protein D0Y65_018818 [Glycine soja]